MYILTNKSTTRNININLNPNEINYTFINISKTVLPEENNDSLTNYSLPEELFRFCKNKNPKKYFEIPYFSVQEAARLIEQLKIKSSTGSDNISK